MRRTATRGRAHTSRDIGGVYSTLAGVRGSPGAGPGEPIPAADGGRLEALSTRVVDVPEWSEGRPDLGVARRVPRRPDPRRWEGGVATSAIDNLGVPAASLYRRLSSVGSARTGDASGTCRGGGG